MTRVADANNFTEITRALDAFKATEDRPTLIIVDSHIGYGSPHKQDTAAAHGEPLGDEEVRETKRFYGWPEDAAVPGPRRGPRALRRGDRRPRRRAALDRVAASCWSATSASTSRSSARSARCSGASCPTAGIATSRRSSADAKGIATRKASNQVQNAIAANVPVAAQRLGRPHGLDLGAPRRGTQRRRLPARTTAAGRQLHYGIREHESAAISNGLSLSKLRPSWSTYLTFSDYARPAIRLSALMELPVIHIFTHDSIGLGEDGPTHQPVEQLASLRAIPGLNVIRPCDANEVAEAWRVIMEADHLPTALVLTRQNVPVIDRSSTRPPTACAAAATCSPTPTAAIPELILIATG